MVIWDTTSNVEKSALAKFSLYWPILMASSHSSTVLKLEKSGMLRSSRGRWTLSETSEEWRGGGTGGIRRGSATRAVKLKQHHQRRPPEQSPTVNYYIVITDGAQEAAVALSMRQHFPSRFLIKCIFQMK